MNLSPRLLLPALAGIALLAGGCGTSTIERSDLESTVQKQLEANVGEKAPKASCPDELKPETGATTRCSMTFDEGKLGITVKVKSVDDDTYKLDIAADDGFDKQQ